MSAHRATKPSGTISTRSGSTSTSTRNSRNGTNPPKRSTRLHLAMRPRLEAHQATITAKANRLVRRSRPRWEVITRTMAEREDLAEVVTLPRMRDLRDNCKKKKTRELDRAAREGQRTTITEVHLKVLTDSRTDSNKAIARLRCHKTRTAGRRVASWAS